MEMVAWLMIFYEWQENILGNNLLHNTSYMKYKHTQIGYLMLIVTLAVLVLFAWTYITGANEPPSVDSGNNFLMTSIMVIILCILTSFGTLQVHIDGKHLRIRFGYGIYRKKFLLNDIISVKTVKNHRWYGRGIRRWLWRKMWIYNVSGFDAIEIQMKNGKIYRIGTDEPKKLEQAILSSIK